MARSRISVSEAFQVLGLPYGASWDEIRDRFRKLAKEWHPDRSAQPNAEERFGIIASAYERLEEWHSRGRPAEYSYRRNPVEEVNRRKAEQDYREKQRRRELLKRARLRKLRQDREQAKEYRKALGIILGFLLLYFGGREISEAYRNYLIDKDPGVTYARVYEQEQNLIRYTYVVGDRVFLDEERVRYSRNSNRSDNGMPLRLNDLFAVRYYKGDPEYHELDFMSPHPNTLERYMGSGQRRLVALFPGSFKELSASDQLTNSRCLVLTVFDAFGFDGLANLTYSGESFWKNWSNNRGTFESMVEEEDFHKCFDSCRLTFTEPLMAD